MEIITLTNINVHTVTFNTDGLTIKYTVRDSHKGANKHVHADCNPVGHTEHNRALYLPEAIEECVERRSYESRGSL